MSELSKEGLLQALEMMLLRTCNDLFQHEPSQYAEPMTEKIRQAYQQIREMIQKPEVTEEWIAQKARELITMVANLYPHEASPCVIPKGKAKDFIRLLVEAIPAKKIIVSEGFVEKWADKFDGFAQQGLIIDIGLLKQMLTEAGVNIIS